MIVFNISLFNKWIPEEDYRPPQAQPYNSSDCTSRARRARRYNTEQTDKSSGTKCIGINLLNVFFSIPTGMRIRNGSHSVFIHTEKTTFTVLLPGCINSPTHCHNSPRNSQPSGHTAEHCNVPLHLWHYVYQLKALAEHACSRGWEINPTKTLGSTTATLFLTASGLSTKTSFQSKKTNDCTFHLLEWRRKHNTKRASLGSGGSMIPT